MSIKGQYKLDSKEIRVYKKEDSCVFKKNSEEFGGLSNMATGFPLLVNGIKIRTAEALYQACRFPHLPDIQQKIIEQNSPMTVKMISNSNKKNSRADWDSIRLKVMKWCISVKLAQNFVLFGAVLHETGLKSIVENSTKDNYWGAIPNEDSSIFTGKNALGRLLMDLRQAFYSKNNFLLLHVEPIKIENFLLYSEPIGIIDERQNFINYLKNFWSITYNKDFNITTQMEIINAEEKEPFYVTKESKMNDGVENNNYETTKKTYQKRLSKKEKANKDSQPNLFNQI